MNFTHACNQEKVIRDNSRKQTEHENEKLKKLSIIGSIHATCHKTIRGPRTLQGTESKSGGNVLYIKFI